MCVCKCKNNILHSKKKILQTSCKHHADTKKTHIYIVNTFKTIKALKAIKAL